MTGSPQRSAPELLPHGLDGLVLRFATALTEEANAAVQAFRARAEAADLDGVLEIVPALASLYLRFDPAVTSRAALAEALRAMLDGADAATAAPPPRRRWIIPACFEGADAPELGEMARLAGLSEAEAIRALTETETRVLAIGFAPGQPYLGLLPPQWNVPRRTSLTREVPAGALVAALRQLVLFANPSPTGWRQVGRCALRVFQPEAERPFALQPGDALRFRAVSGAELERLDREAGDGLGGAVLERLR
ncbi:5-oxoprolinase subunit B family protein [Poseidonocella sedimentorum]|uniref:Sensor histidine kinase inhibitor, KipI family n=1 Tax=Poseidonocella sedimentorum TaxID=871652 RepID=A0A1I6D4K5_9RHOB|nr:carboxyltransferase domain-containing protein [Poseidonocella sedimentorum]SFR00303.1 sensor histidine kinase inhibitor, KipI family [Poseidonocella sedimentorum]